MALPVVPHRLTKIRAQNRVRLIRSAFLFSVCAVMANTLSVSTNEWLHTSEVLKYFVFPNRTDEEQNPPTYFKNATLGPWLFCWSDPLTDWNCTGIDVLGLDDPSDVTTAVELSVRRCVLFMVAGCCLDSLGLISVCLCLLRHSPYGSLLSATVVNILAGLVNFACIIVYITAVSKEIGNKIYKASNIDDSLFHYSYGFSFLLLKVSFLCTELSALFCVIVYMAKRDERTYNAYRMRSMLRHVRADYSLMAANGCCDDGRHSPFERQLLDNERYHRHTRMNTLRRKVSNSSSQDLSQLLAATLPGSSPPKMPKFTGHYFLAPPSPSQMMGTGRHQQQKSSNASPYNSQSEEQQQNNNNNTSSPLLLNAFNLAITNDNNHCT